MEKWGPRYTDTDTDTSDVTCLSTQLCRLQALARSSQWDQVADTLSDVETSWCVEGVLERAMTEGQWHCVVRLASHCSVQQRERAVQQAATHDQWSSVAEMVELGVGSAVRNRLLKLAVAARQTRCAALLVSAGVCGQVRQDSLTQALDLVEVCGDDSVAVWDDDRDSLGVWGLYNGSLTREVDSGQCDFVLELMAACDDCDMTDFVLTQAATQGHWPLVWGLVRLGLDAGQLERVYEYAVDRGQWDLVIHLLQPGVNSSDQVVSKLCECRLAQHLLDAVPAGAMTRGMAGWLLLESIAHDQVDISLQVIQREKVSDNDVMMAVKCAVQQRDKDNFTKLITQSPRCRRVFSQHCHYHPWTRGGPCHHSTTGGPCHHWTISGPCHNQHYQTRWERCHNQHYRTNGAPCHSRHYRTRGEPCDDLPESEVCWLYRTLCTGGQPALALHVVTAQGFAEADSWKSYLHLLDFRKPKFRRLLMKLYEDDRDEFACLVLEKYQRWEADRSVLFRLAIRLGDFEFAGSLFVYGVQRTDLRFVVAWLLTSQDTEALSSFRGELAIATRELFDKCSLEYAVKQYYRGKSESKATAFIDHFWSGLDKALFSQLFISAITKAVKQGII